MLLLLSHIYFAIGYCIYIWCVRVHAVVCRVVDTGAGDLRNSDSFSGKRYTLNAPLTIVYYNMQQVMSDILAAD